MDGPEKDYAQPGDTIEVTEDGLTRFGDQFVVAPIPVELRIPIKTGKVWVPNWGPSGEPILLRADYYKVIKRSGNHQQDTKSVDASLRKQMNANLRSIFE